MQEAWSIYGARFRTPAAALEVQRLLTDSFDPSFEASLGAHDLNIIQDASQPPAVQLDNVRLISSKMPVESAALAEQMRSDLELKDPAISLACLQKMASVHLSVTSLCLTTSFLDQNGLYLGQKGWLKVWIR